MYVFVVLVLQAAPDSHKGGEVFEKEPFQAHIKIARCAAGNFWKGFCWFGVAFLGMS